MRTIDYYCSLNSPWSYLGHDRLVGLAAGHNASIRIHPVDYAIIFPATGGLPVARRAPQRQEYRLAELRRWRRHLGIALNLAPAHWPADERLAAAMVIAARDRGADAVGLAGAMMRAVWVEDRNIADRGTLDAIAAEQDLDAGALLEDLDTCLALRERESRDAIEAGVFGAPTYRLNGDLFWGQDRLDFVERALTAR